MRIEQITFALPALKTLMIATAIITFVALAALYCLSLFKNSEPLPQVDHKVTVVKQKQAAELKHLRALAEKGHWSSLQQHEGAGFDWWMFPTDRASLGYGDQYQLSASHIATLKKDPEFMKSYRDGVILVARSWGFELEGKPVSSSQKWTNYQVRLGKMLDSLRLFGQDDLRKGVSSYAKQCRLESWIQNLLLS